MDKLYRIGNYLHIEQGTEIYDLPVVLTSFVYNNYSSQFEISNPTTQQRIIITFADAVSYEDSLAVVYTVASMYNYLQLNTGYTEGVYNLAGIIYDKQIIVNQSNISTTLGGVIDSDVEYFIDGVVDCDGVIIEIPATGLAIKGHSFDISRLICSNASYTLFNSPVGGSGNLLMENLAIEITGTGSKVFDIVDSTGFNALEITRINYNNCTSLGDIDGYRQGLENGTGRFGSSPSLTLHGTWLGGFLISDSIVRSMSDSTTEPLFKSGISFVMNSRFKTNMNVDLGTLQPFIDFSDANFPKSSTLQIQDCEITRDGVYNSNDANISPNINQSNLSSLWVNNNGVNNTHVGGVLTLSSELSTTIATIGVYVPMSATYSSSDLQHFDSPSSGQLRNLGGTPREFKIIAYIVMEGTANEVLTVRVRKYNSTTLATSTVVTQSATVNNFSGANDRCVFNIIGRTELDENDYYFLDVANMTSTNPVTAKIGTFTTIERR